MSDRFTEEELNIAKSVDLIEVARSLGYTPKKIGRFYTLKEMDSMRIYDRKNWFRFSGKCESELLTALTSAPACTRRVYSELRVTS